MRGLRRETGEVLEARCLATDFVGRVFSFLKRLFRFSIRETGENRDGFADGVRHDDFVGAEFSREGNFAGGGAENAGLAGGAEID